MLSLITAAELQYRFDTAILARDNARLVAIRERREALTVESTRITTPLRVVRTRTVWARPIGAHSVRSGDIACAAA